jgi:hypothetical protein
MWPYILAAGVPSVLDAGPETLVEPDPETEPELPPGLAPLIAEQLRHAMEPTIADDVMQAITYGPVMPNTYAIQEAEFWEPDEVPVVGANDAAAQSLGLLAGMAGAFGFGGSDLPPLRLSPPIRNHTSAEALARAEEKRARKAAARRGKA